MPHNHTLADTKRDAVALYRAVLGRDGTGAHVIQRNTRCKDCLAIQVATLGLILAAEDADCIGLDGDGNLAIAEDELRRLDSVLAGMLSDLGETGEG